MLGLINYHSYSSAFTLKSIGLVIKTALLMYMELALNFKISKICHNEFSRSYKENDLDINGNNNLWYISSRLIKTWWTFQTFFPEILLVYLVIVKLFIDIV